MKKRWITITIILISIMVVSSAFADEIDKKMSKWAGVSRVDSFIGAKVVFDPDGNKNSAHGNLILYPWAWGDEESFNLLGVGYKGNYWESPSGHGQRHLGQFALRGYRDWGNYRLALLGGVQNEDYGESHPRYNLYGIGGYLSLNHKDLDGEKAFPKTELWAQALKADGRNSQSTTDGIIDVGGRQYLYEGDFKPFLGADLSLGTPDKYASLGIGLGATDRNEILFLSVGPQLDLKKEGVFSFANAGLDTSNLISWIIREDAKKQVKKAP